MTSIVWPSALPAMRFGSTWRPQSPQIASNLESGRVRIRRNFTAAPVFNEVEFIMDDAQAVAFEAFYRDTLKDGTEWFMMDVLLPQGRGPRKMQFMGIYEGPTRINSPSHSKGFWRYTANLQMFLRPTDGD